MTANDQLQESAIAHAVDLRAYSDSAVRQMLTILNRSEVTLMVELRAVLDRLGPDSFTVQRLESQLGTVRQTIAASYERLSGQLSTELQDFARYETAWQATTMEAALPAVINVATVAPAQVYAAAMARPFQGALLSQWITTLDTDTATRVRRSIVQGFSESKTTDQIIRDIRGTKARGYKDGALEISRREAEAVVRTALSHTAAVAGEQFETRNADIIKQVRWLSTLDTRTSPPCFPGSTLALPVGDVRGMTRRHWDGDLVVITTASGKKLRSTPNHPVLTARGWRAAQEVRPGQDVLYRVAADVGSIPASEHVEVPATMSAVFDALHKPAFADVATERAAEVDFHGDGMMGEYEINHPRSKGYLRSALDATFGQKVAKQLLVFVAAPGQLPSSRHGFEGFRGVGAASMSAQVYAGAIQDGVQPGLAHVVGAADLGGRHAFTEFAHELEFIRASLVLAAPQGLHDACAFESAGDRGGADPVDAGQLAGADAFGILADDVVSLEREAFSGHVYNLSTSTEFYIADGFVVHNCRLRDGLLYEAGTHKPVGHSYPWGAGPGQFHWRCRSTRTFVTKGWQAYGIDSFTPAERASMDGQVPAELSYGDWLKRQSAARQNEVLGVERGKLFRSGDLTLDQMYSARGVPLTLEQLRKKL